MKTYLVQLKALAIAFIGFALFKIYFAIFVDRTNELHLDVGIIHVLLALLTWTIHSALSAKK